MSTDEFLCWLVKSKPITIAFEACSTSNYCYQQAIKVGHDARFVNAKLVKAVRQINPSALADRYLISRLIKALILIKRS